MQQAITSYLRVALTPFVIAGLAACSTSGIGTTTVAADGIEQGKLPCPQRRDTERAPASYYSRLNPLPRTATNLEQGRLLYLEDGKPMSCASCHGVKGDGAGAPGLSLVPAPRNFACAETMASITDGQMYWVIQNGSGDFHLIARQGAQRVERPGRGTRSTAMRAHNEQLSEADVWQLVLYIRTLPSSAETHAPD